MLIVQKNIKLSPKPRGFHLVTHEICNQLELSSIRIGICQVFIKHTSASLSLNENADPTVREDMDQFFDRLCPDDTDYFKHISEGPDDMPAHIKSALLGSSLTIPITDGRLSLGTWQGIYLCEHRTNAHSRDIVITGFGRE